MNISSIRNAVCGHADTVGKTKRGTFMIRRSFFYRNGMDSAQFAARILSTLTSKGMNVILVGSGEKWAAFSGGQSVAQGSHWWVEVQAV